MPDSQSSEPEFESPFVTVSKIGHFRSLHWRPCSLSCINEYLAIDSGGHVSDLALARNCCLARMLPGEAELVSEWTGLPGEAKSVKRFERSNGLDTALYKNYLYLFFTSADLLLFVLLSRHVPTSIPPHPLPKISMAFLCFFRLPLILLVLSSPVFGVFLYFRNNLVFAF